MAFIKSNIHPGDKLEFGRYKQSVSGELLPIAGEILEVRDNTALLISESVLDMKMYSRFCVLFMSLAFGAFR